jgi:hypothetical protein
MELTWQEERETLTLEGEPVLEYTLRWPQWTGGGWEGRHRNAYYRYLAKNWRDRWRRQVYWRACLDLAQRRAAAKPFTPWTGQLTGEVTAQAEDLVRVQMTGAETQGDAQPSRVQWSDAWQG